MRFLFLLAALAGCSDLDATEYPDAADDPQVPARGPNATAAWIAAGHYMTWHCEAARHPAAPGSPHSTNRICTNDALYDGDRISGYALMRKVSADSNGGAGWYWWEAFDGEVVTAAHGSGTCTGCHGRAPRDYAYTVVP